MRIAVTGTTGFIGSALAAHLARQGHVVTAIARSDLPTPGLDGVEVIIHCAGIAHRAGRNAPDAAEYEQVNHVMAVALARHAASVGVRRMVFVSTINVGTGNPSPLAPDMPYRPTSPYGTAKARAEMSLLKLSGIEIVVARPSLVYGPGARGNLNLLLRLSRSRLPLPLGLARNRRNMLSMTNAVRALEFLAVTNGLAGRIFHLADPQPLSMAQLVTTIRASLGRQPGLLPVPPAIMRGALALVGRSTMAEQLFGNLEVDTSALAAAGFVFSDGTPDLQAMATHP